MALDVSVFREALRQERDALQARLRYVDMTLEGLDGLDATGHASAETDLPAPASDTAGRMYVTKVRTRRGLSAKLARDAIQEAGRLTPEQLAQAMLARGWTTPAANPTGAARAAGNRVRDTDDEIVYENGAFVYKPYAEPDAQPPSNGSGP